MTNEETQRRTLARRQQVVKFLETPQTMSQIRDHFGISASCACDDIQYLKSIGVLSLHSGKPRAPGKKAAKWICKQVTLKMNTESGLSDINFSNYPPILLKFLGHNATKPATANFVHKRLEQPAPKETLRKINTAWMGYQSGLELA